MGQDGVDAFDIDTLETSNDVASADEAERWWIAHFGANDSRFGFNVEAGGRKKGHAPMSSKEKMRARWTPERKAATSSRHRGKTISEEAKRVVGEKAKARAAARHAAGILPKSQSEHASAYRERNLEECRRRDRERKRARRAAGRVRQ